MKKALLFLVLSVFFAEMTLCQEKLEVEGAIILGNSEDVTPVPGTIRWTGLNFEGWNGFKWLLLTNFKMESVITDVDGNKYPTVKIGGQEWMAENLRVSKYRNGIDIANYVTDADWSTAPFGAWSWYDNNSSNEQTYGKLYNWFAVANTLWGLCPTGWHPPTDGEWTILTTFLGGETIAGGKMKTTETGYWQDPNSFATNESGFTGLPGGNRNNNGSFNNLGNNSLWWSSTESGANAWYRALGYNYDDVFRSVTDKRSGLSVRCLRD